MNKYFPYKELSYKLVGIFYKIRNQYGNAQKEKVYQNALAEELEKLKIPYKKEVEIPIKSPETGKKLGNYRIDFVVDEKIVVEIKALNFTP
ncbi:MAG: GxxExxY protein, partial [Microgenomates group bacterium]